jgi:hypothetical protein
VKGRKIIRPYNLIKGISLDLFKEGIVGFLFYYFIFTLCELIDRIFGKRQNLPKGRGSLMLYGPII